MPAKITEIRLFIEVRAWSTVLVAGRSRENFSTDNDSVGVARARRKPFAQHDPRTGHYLAPDGQMYRQLFTSPKTWQDMLRA